MDWWWNRDTKQVGSLPSVGKSVTHVEIYVLAPRDIGKKSYVATPTMRVEMALPVQPNLARQR